MYYNEPQRGNGFGVTALVLGIIGIMLGLIPVINYLAIVGGVVGLVLGAIGIFKNRNQWLAAWGTVLSGAAIVVSVVVNVKFAENLEDLSNDFHSRSESNVAPVEQPKKPAAKPNAVSNGIYQVGVDIPAGRYKTAGPPADDIMPMCFWSRNSDDSGSLESIIANGGIEGPGSLTVNAGEFVEFSGDCTWRKVK